MKETVPTPYTNAIEMMILTEFQKKIGKEEGEATLEKSEMPDGIIRTSDGKIIGVEVTTAFRTDDSSDEPDEKNRLAIFLNKHGIYNPKSPPYATLSESFVGDGQELALISKIKERISEKEGNNAYADFKTRFHKSVLVVYLDDLLLTSPGLEKVIADANNIQPIEKFDEIYAFVRPVSHTSPEGGKRIGGFYLIAKKRLS